MFGGGYII